MLLILLNLYYIDKFIFYNCIEGLVIGIKYTIFIAAQNTIKESAW